MTKRPAAAVPEVHPSCDRYLLAQAGTTVITVGSTRTGTRRPWPRSSRGCGRRHPD